LPLSRPPSGLAACGGIAGPGPEPGRGQASEAGGFSPIHRDVDGLLRLPLSRSRTRRGRRERWRGRLVPPRGLCRDAGDGPRPSWQPLGACVTGPVNRPWAMRVRIGTVRCRYKTPSDARSARTSWPPERDRRPDAEPRPLRSLLRVPYLTLIATMIRSRGEGQVSEGRLSSWPRATIQELGVDRRALLAGIGANSPYLRTTQLVKPWLESNSKAVT